MIGFDGTELGAETRALIAELHIGGLILFSQNLDTPEQIARLCRQAQAQAAACGLPPLFIAIDQEGGQVARLREPFTVFDGNPAMRGRNDAAHFGRVTAAELSALGINMDMAPVVDVAFTADSVMDRRAFAGDPARVAEMGVAVIEALQGNGVMAVAKHFPGIGRTTLDSHLDRPLLDTPWRELAASDLLPFEAAVRRGVSGVMLSHIVYRDRDPRWPASLSVKIAHDVLRDRMGYDGLVMTDDLDMGAIKKYYDIDTVMQRVLAADIDLALICHRGPDIARAYEVMLSELGKSARLRRRARRSAGRILATKEKYIPLTSPTDHPSRTRE